MATHSSLTEAGIERRSRRFWVLLVLGFFSLDLAIAIVAIVMAASDPSFRPLPDYGERSVAWEAHHQARLRSDQIGWSVSASAVEPHRQAIEFVVVDRAGLPVTDAKGDVSAYHLTRVSQQQRSHVEEVGEGRYQARIDCRRKGLWKIELCLARTRPSSANNPTNEDVFVYEAIVEIPAREEVPK